MKRSRSFAQVLLMACAGCGVHEAEPPEEPVPLPFVVSDFYSPDGYWGDGEKRGAVVLDKSCPQRAPAATGDCYTITYQPGDRHFAGINWQYPHNNWGTDPGLRIAGGAARITGQARGERGGELVGLGAGQANTHNPHDDGFNVGPFDFDLATKWAPFSIPLGGQTYAGPSGLIGAFILTLRAGDDERPQVIYLDALRWEK